MGWGRRELGSGELGSGELGSGELRSRGWGRGSWGRGVGVEGLRWGVGFEVGRVVGGLGWVGRVGVRGVGVWGVGVGKVGVKGGKVEGVGVGWSRELGSGELRLRGVGFEGSG